LLWFGFAVSCLRGVLSPFLFASSILDTDPHMDEGRTGEEEKEKRKVAKEAGV
jgi:hypothetical protein